MGRFSGVAASPRGGVEGEQLKTAPPDQHEATGGAADLIGGLVFLVLIVSWFAWAGRIDLAFSFELETITGPRAYPRQLLALMALFNVAVIARAFVNRAGRPSACDGLPPTPDRRRLRAAGVYVILIVFVLAFEPVGYLLAMPALLVTVALLSGAARPGQAFAMAVLLSLGCLVLFRYGLDTVLPEGILGIDQLL